MAILSFQSRVAMGHVGNAGAVFCLQRLGHEIWPIDTALLSNHLGYRRHGGRILEAGESLALLDGLAANGALNQVEAVLSGFLGRSAATVAEAVTRVRRANPDALYCLDPVMGEREGGLYVAPATAEAVARDLLPQSDIVMPNMFELDYLAGRASDSLADALDAADRLRAVGRPGRRVIVTGLARREAPADRIEILAVGPDGAWLLNHPRRRISAHGTGDCFAALFLGHYLAGGAADLPGALALAATAIDAVVETTGSAPELRLVAAQDRLAPARPAYEPQRVR